MTVPYQPLNQAGFSPRHLYTSVAQVSRLYPELQGDGNMKLTWYDVPDIVDVHLDIPGQLQCRLDLTFIRPGKDQPPAIVTGRAPDRVGVLFYDPATNDDGVPYIKSGDLITMISGPIAGSFEIRTNPDVAQSYTGAHHVEVQVVEVVHKSSGTTTPTPYPGSPA